MTGCYPSVRANPATDKTLLQSVEPDRSRMSISGGCRNQHISFDFQFPYHCTCTKQKIDWESGDKDHIWEGSKNHGGHDWSPFGIGPNDPKGWDKLLPLLKIVADQGQKWNNPNQTKPIPNAKYYIYRFEQYSYSIILKLFNNGGQYSISDAYPIP